MPRRVSSPSFVGREVELGTLVTALERAAGGRSTFVLLAGESGVGKTRLLRELHGRADDMGARVLSGDSVEVGEGRLPYAPIVAALRPLARELGAEGLERLAGPSAVELAPLLPELATGRAGPGGDIHPHIPVLAQARLFEVLLLVLRRLGEEAPLLLLIEDIHWADGSTRDFLTFLVRNACSERLATVVTYRSDELHRKHPLRPFLAVAEREKMVERVELPRFSRAELDEQLQGILEAAPDPLLATELFERSEGNPFFAEELLAASEETGGARLPETLRDALVGRVEALSPAAISALRVAAAAGRKVSHRLLSSGAGFDESELNRALREAVAHHVLVQHPDDESYAFRHALLREAVYEDLLPGERSGLHLALANALTRDPELSAGPGGAAAELAWHWHQAHELPAALAASIEAGRQAEATHASAEASRHFENAIELWEQVKPEERPDGIHLGDVLEWAAEATYRHGDYARATAIADRALEVFTEKGAGPLRLAEIHERRGTYRWSDGRIHDALAIYREAAGLMPADEPTAQQARLLASEAQILMLVGRIDECRPRAEEAVAIARRVGDREIEGHAMNTLGVCSITHGDPETAIGLLEQSLAIAREQNETGDACRALTNLSDVLDQLGQVKKAAELALEGRRIARDNGFAGSYGLFLEAEAADRLTRLGRWDETREVLGASLDRRVSGLTGAHALEVRAAFDVRCGDLDGARERMRRASQVHADKGGSMWLGPLFATDAELAVWSGRAEDAWPAYEGYLESLGDEPDYAFYVVRGHAAVTTAEADLAERARALGDEDGEALHRLRAEQVARHAAGIELGKDPPLARAWVEVCHAEAARAAGEPDECRWAAAADLFGELEQPFELALVRWRRAEALLTAGEREAAAAQLGAAREGAERLGAELLLREIESLARRARLGVAPAAAAAGSSNGQADGEVDPLGLTDRELEVLRLVAEGLTNREIAARLYISDKTASVHVSRILAKLDVRSRVEAAGVAHRLGMTE